MGREKKHLLILRINNHGKSTLRSRSYSGDHLGYRIFWIRCRRYHSRSAGNRNCIVPAKIYKKGGLIGQIKKPNDRLIRPGFYVSAGAKSILSPDQLCFLNFIE